MNWFTLAFESALLSAAAAIAQKRILFRVDALSFSFALSLAIMLISFIAPFFVDVTAISVLTLGVLVIKGTINALAFVLVMMMLERADISGTLPLLALTPGVTAVLAFLFIGESIAPVEIFGISLMMAGVFILERKPFGLGSFKNQRYIMGALFLFSISAVIDKFLVTNLRTSPIVVLFYQHAVFLAVYTIMILGRRRSLRSFSWMREVPILSLILIVAILTVGYRMTQLLAVRSGDVAVVLAIKRTSVFYASLVGGKIFRERSLVIRLTAAALIIAAGFAILRNVA